MTISIEALIRRCLGAHPRETLRLFSVEFLYARLGLRPGGSRSTVLRPYLRIQKAAFLHCRDIFLRFAAVYCGLLATVGVFTNADDCHL